MPVTCERCGAMPAGRFELLDYCATCGRNLCPKCMALGHCGNVPAVSGQGEDHSKEAPSAQPT